MEQIETSRLSSSRRIWIIDEIRHSDVDPAWICKIQPDGPVKAYRLSQIGRYMLNPEPVEVNKRLVGCQIHPLAGGGPGAGRWLRRRLPRRFAAPAPSPRTILAQGKTNLPPLETGALIEHMALLEERLRPLDPILGQLRAIDPRRTTDVLGICEDAGGQRSFLTIQGSIADKIDYVIGHLNQNVAVILDRAYGHEGFFDLIGMDFQGFDPERGFSMLRFPHEGQIKACVLDESGALDFWIETPGLIQYLLLFEQSVQSNPHLSASLALCAGGKALPLKLFFKKKLNIIYSRANPPSLYKEIFEKLDAAPRVRETVLSMLKDRQVGVSFNYVPRDTPGAQRLLTEVSVLQDCRVLEAVRAHLPDLVSEISRRASTSEIGRFYLLDSMRDSRHEQ